MSTGRQESDYYLGRTTEQGYLRKCLEADGRPRHLVYVSGLGGAGKTALLEHAPHLLRDPAQGKVTFVAIDFDDLTLRLPGNLMERIVDRLASQGLSAHFEEFRGLYQRGEEGFSESKKGQEAARKAFVGGLQALTEQTRLALLVDTLEKAPIWLPAFLGSVLSPVENVVIVAVGRPHSRRVKQALERALAEEKDLPPFQEMSFEWEGLDQEFCQEYFASRQEFQSFDPRLTLLSHEMTANMQERIWLLAQGIPFQINLFVGMLRFLETGNYELARQINDLLSEILAASMAGLERNFELRQRFQRALVAPFVLNYDLPADEDGYDRLTSRILLLIAHINHYLAHALGGFDASVLADLDPILTRGEVERGLDYIERNRRTRFSFVKLFCGPDGRITGIGLHDEMARMLNELGWIRLDPPGASESLRRQISAELVAYYDHKCLELYARGDLTAEISRTEDEKEAALLGRAWGKAVSMPEGQALLLARVFHAMYRDFRNGWNWVYGLSEQIFRQLYFDALLYESVEEYIQAMHIVYGPEIQAQMNAWKAAALIARPELSREDLQEAQALLQDSIRIWSEKYQGDEEEVRHLEERHASLVELRRHALDTLRRSPAQAPHLRPILDSVTAQLGEIERAIQTHTGFADLERAYTSLGFVYRLEGQWKEAIEHYELALRYSRWLRNRRNIAELANNIANVYLLWGRLTDAALYAQVGAIIRGHLGAQTELGHSYWVLGMINWRIGNTYECRKYLNRARECYERPIDLARVDLYEGYTYYRIGDTEIGHKSLVRLPSLVETGQTWQHIPPVRSFSLLEQAREVFEQYERTDDQSWTYNVLSRASRRDGDLEKAKTYASKALELSQNRQRVAEANLSLCALHYRQGQQKLEEGDVKGALGEFDEADRYYHKGAPMASDRNFISLMSVYEGIKGNIEYERAKHLSRARYQKAFRHYLLECQISAQNKMLRFERALNEVVADRVARMPVDLALECTNILTDFDSWKAKGLERQYQKLSDEVDELKLFLGLPEKQQIDSMEASFNQHMQFGQYQQALKEATYALKQFRRYNWSIDSVRVLLKTAQAYRKVTQFTAARRYCKQALLALDNLAESATGQARPVEVALQKAHADFTMGRILWEIGNTAEAATHFRFARETYLEYRRHNDPAIALEMREGLARSVQYEGFMRFRIGEFDQALEFLEWAETEYRALRNMRRISKTLNLKARIYRDRYEPDDITRARQALEEALNLALGVKDEYAIAECYLTYMILEYQETMNARDVGEQMQYLDAAERWYQAGAHHAHDNGYALLQAVFEGVMGNVIFDRATLRAGEKGQGDLRPAFDRFLEECRWDAHFEERRFFRSLDFLMQRLSTLNSDEVRYYNNYILEKWQSFVREGKLPGEAPAGQYYGTAEEYISHMQRFCRLVEDFSEYIARR